MGCDIHVVIEEKFDGCWIGVVSTDRLRVRPVYAQRDYEFFNAIAGVRGKGGKQPLGFPNDVSQLSQYLFSEAPTDYHSASYMSVDEFCTIHNKIRPSASRAEYSTFDISGIFSEFSGDFRVVFWFDN